MERIVSTPDPGEFSRPLANGHAPALLVEDLAAYEAAPTLRATPQLVTEQTSILDQDLETFLAEEPSTLLADRDTASVAPASSDEVAETLPGFESLTPSDLQLCPSWCIHQDLPTHSDGFDQDPDSAPHRGVEHTIHAIHGGESLDHAGRADVTVQLEQDRDLSTGPVITLSVIVRGIEQYAWLTLPETRALHHALGHLLTETND